MKLTYQSGEHQGKTLEVGDRPIVVGRGADADVVLRDDSEVSRRHASIETRPDGTLLLTDLGSTNGTYENGQRISGSTVLRGDEEVRIGETRLKVGAPE